MSICDQQIAIFDQKLLLFAKKKPFLTEKWRKTPEICPRGFTSYPYASKHIQTAQYPPRSSGIVLGI